MSNSVGKINLDLFLNKGAFQKEINNVGNYAQNSLGKAFSGVGKMLAGVVAGIGLAKFTSDCLRLGSNLAEVQNVVDVTFGGMSKYIDDFAENQALSFGLSETSAKQYTGVIGSMLKSMGLGTAEAKDMSIEMTKLAGDMASFYNLDTDLAFEKIRAGISGETEPLKQLGINMSVANLEAYAMSQGITQSYQKMDQASQALLRYNYLMSTTADAQGDFARTGGGWANQVRMMKLQWDSFRASVGQVFIAVLLPVVQMLNKVLGWVNTVTKAFAKMVSTITGKKVTSSTSNISSGMDDIASGASGASNAVDGVTDATTDAGKAAKNAQKAFSGLLGIDEANIISKDTNTDDSGSGGSGGGSAGTESEGTDGDTVSESSDNANSSLQKLISIGKEFSLMVSSLFVPSIDAWGKAFDNFSIGIAPSFEMVKKSVMSFWKNGLVPLAGYILTDYIPSIVNSFSTNFAPVFSQLGVKSVGVFSKYVATSLGNTTELINSTIIPSADRIKNAYLSNMPLAAKGFSILGNAAIDAADYILNDFMLPINKAFNEMFIPIFTDFAVGAMNIFTNVFANTATFIATVWSSTLQPLFELIKKIILDTFSIIQVAWNQYGDPMISKIEVAVDRILEIFWQIYDIVYLAIIKPTLEMLSRLWDEHIKGMIEQFATFVGKLVNFALDIYNNVIAPIVSFLLDTLKPIFIDVFGTIIRVVENIAGPIADTINNVLKTLGGIIDFITGVFTGDWSKAWDGVKSIFSGIWESLVGIVRGVWDTIIGLFTLGGSIFGGIADAIAGVFKGIVNTLIGGINNVIAFPFNKINGLLNDIRKTSFLGVTPFDFIPHNVLPVPQIPMLAQGGYVGANQPQLAMIGDNKHYGEIVAPEDKLNEIMNTALEKHQGQTESAFDPMIVELLEKICHILETLNLVGEFDIDGLVRLINKRKERLGMEMMR